MMLNQGAAWRRWLGQLVRVGNFAGRPAPDVSLARTPPAHAGDGQDVAALDAALSRKLSLPIPPGGSTQENWD